MIVCHVRLAAGLRSCCGNGRNHQRLVWRRKSWRPFQGLVDLLVVAVHRVVNGHLSRGRSLEGWRASLVVQRGQGGSCGAGTRKGKGLERRQTRSCEKARGSKPRRVSVGNPTVRRRSSEGSVHSSTVGGGSCCCLGSLVVGRSRGDRDGSLDGVHGTRLHRLGLAGLGVSAFRLGSAFGGKRGFTRGSMKFWRVLLDFVNRWPRGQWLNHSLLLMEQRGCRLGSGGGSGSGSERHRGRCGRSLSCDGCERPLVLDLLLLAVLQGFQGRQEGHHSRTVGGTCCSVLVRILIVSKLGVGSGVLDGTALRTHGRCSLPFLAVIGSQKDGFVISWILHGHCVCVCFVWKGPGNDCV